MTSKAQQIRDLLLQGTYTNTEIANLVGTNPAYVSDVKKLWENERSPHFFKAADGLATWMTTICLRMDSVELRLKKIEQRLFDLELPGDE